MEEISILLKEILKETIIKNNVIINPTKIINHSFADNLIKYFKNQSIKE